MAYFSIQRRSPTSSKRVMSEGAELAPGRVRCFRPRAEQVMGEIRKQFMEDPPTMELYILTGHSALAVSS